MPSTSVPSQATKAWIITGPTSGIGYRTALELRSTRTVVLVGRDATKLANVKQEIEAKGCVAVAVVADLSDIDSVRSAASEIVNLGLPVGGLLNNAGIMPMRPFTTAQGWDGAFGRTISVRSPSPSRSSHTCPTA